MISSSTIELLLHKIVPPGAFIRHMPPRRRTPYPLARSNASPLIDPTVSAVVVVAPQRDELNRLSPHMRLRLQYGLSVLAQAADIVEVPVFAVTPGRRPRRHGLSTIVPSLLARQHVLSSNRAGSWFGGELTSTLDNANRTTVILAGCWLEHQILASTLHALADGFDAYVALDATPARSQQGAAPTRERLAHAGAMPVTSSQVVYEWFLESPTSHARRALAPLLESMFGA